jgi:calpain-15
MKLKGIASNHSYGLLATAEVVDKEGNHVKLLKLRNPWGTFEWKGDWGDLSDKWTPELKAQVKLDGDSDDGLFWISLEDFIKHYDTFEICKFKENQIFNHFHKEQTN